MEFSLATISEKRVIKASKDGLEQAKLAIKKLGLNQTSYTLIQKSITTDGTLRRFWRGIPIQSQTFISICNALELDWQQIADTNSYISLPVRIDWGEAPDVDAAGFLGRNEKLTELKKWLVNERCQVVELIGLGGIGKTFLAVRLVEQILDKFEYVIWRSLNNAPLLSTLLENLSFFFSKSQQTNSDISQLISRYLRQHKCLIVLDDWEAIMSSGTLTGKYREGYEDYGQLLKQLSEISHQSILLLLSREKPPEISPETESCVRIYKLRGLSHEEALPILKKVDLSGTENDLEELIRRYKGNPLALKIVAQNINTLFQGSLSSFLKATKVFLPDPILNILYEHFYCLSDIEKQIIYWLAIMRNSASFSQLQEYISPLITTNNLMVALISLIERRSLAESNQEGERVIYQLDPIILKYVTNKFVENVCEEILEISESQSIEALDLLKSHTFITSSEKSTVVGKEQFCLIVKPIKEQLCAEFRQKRKAEEKLLGILSLLEQSTLLDSYACNNVQKIISCIKE